MLGGKLATTRIECQRKDAVRAHKIVQRNAVLVQIRLALAEITSRSVRRRFTATSHTRLLSIRMGLG